MKAFNIKEKAFGEKYKLDMENESEEKLRLNQTIMKLQRDNEVEKKMA